MKIDYLKLTMPNKIDVPKTKQEKALKKTTEEFESIFLKMMMDEMDKTVDRKNSMFYGGNAEDVFRGMLNQKRADSWSKSGGVGLAKVMYEQLSKGLHEGGKK
ncbi:rod-binding protein [Haliovirga abyssi]|uniref:Flagellar protein FlgJ N-terminal domain-containing protein n=1 Tax=Haliovirga abyssi TaxID=2996794 RepID=A0AAU9DDI7_9FUSO|nr:rod-binding protein [Haliovirga abyssi]BDU50228.1 hypothetical protein HLVA_07970 [Haliovirga abyssi]